MLKFLNIQKKVKNKEFTRITVTFLGVKINFKIRTKIKNCVAIVNCDRIGDYMFCRPYFRFLKESPKFKNSYFIYLCKETYQDMIKNYDSNIFDEVITYNKDYKTLIKYLKKYEIEILINTTGLNKKNSFRGWLVRYNLVKNLKAKKKIADVIIDTEEDLKNPNLKIYDELVVTRTKDFELERRRQFFEKLSGINIPQTEKKIQALVNFNFSKDYMCISLFTTATKRNYDENKWIDILNYILNKIPDDMQLIFLGGINDRLKIGNIIEQLNSNSFKCVNLAGLCNISLVPSILKKSKLLLSTETGTVHIAESVNCPTICISCGAFYGRFLPYNTDKISYIFPDEFDKILKENDTKKLESFYLANWTYSTKDIPSQKVIKEIDKFLHNNFSQTGMVVERESNPSIC